MLKGSVESGAQSGLGSSTVSWCRSEHRRDGPPALLFSNLNHTGQAWRALSLSL